MKKKKLARILLFLAWIGGLGLSAAFHYFIYVRHAMTLDHINVWAGLTFLGILLTAFYLIWELLLWIIRLKGGIKTNLRIMGLTIVLIIAIIELGLRVKKVNASYGEGTFFQPYSSFYHPYMDSWFHTWPANSEHEHIAHGEFRYPRKTNSMGLSEVEIPEQKDSSEYRIFAIGDSFTEGVGAPYDSTWAKHLEHILRGSISNRNIKVYNAGIAGSDPVYGYMLFKEQLLPLHPDLVIQAVNFTDEGDVFIKGGMERFREDGTVWNKEGPTWEPLYALSYIYRLYIRHVKGYEDILIDPADRPALEMMATKQIKETLDSYEELTAQNNFKFLTVVHPMWNEVTDQSYEGNQASLLEMIESTEPEMAYVDLMQFYVKDIKIDHDNVWDYYWKEYHHNAKGYLIFAEGVANKILEEGYIE